MPSGCVALDRLMVPDEIERADKTAVAAPITKVALHPTLAITEELQQQVQNFDSFRGAAGVHDYASRPDNTPAYDLRCGPAATLQLPSIAAVRFLSGTPLARPNTGSYPFKAGLLRDAGDVHWKRQQRLRARRAQDIRAHRASALSSEQSSHL
jgi:hypothetical protein